MARARTTAGSADAAPENGTTAGRPEESWSREELAFG